MRITLNGELTDLPAPLTIKDLLDYLSIDGRLVAVELNRKVIKRAEYATTTVTEQSEVEIVSFVGGGC